MQNTITDNLDYTVDNNRNVNRLTSGLPQWVILAAFIIMVVAAIFTITPIDRWFKDYSSIVIALVNTVGMVTMYYAAMRGMKRLYHPLTALWIVIIALNIVTFFAILFESICPEVSFVIACLLPLCYLPLGALIIIWYRGQLRRLGIWMIVRILVVILLPIAWYMLGIGLNDIILDAIIVVTELIYAYLFLRLLW